MNQKIKKQTEQEIHQQAMKDQDKKYLDIKELSEEVQIKGRTARLAQQNSFRIAFLDESLEYQDITISKKIPYSQYEDADLGTTKQINYQNSSHVQIINIPQKQLNSPNFLISQIQNIMKSIETDQSVSIKKALLDNYLQVNLTYEPKMEDFNFEMFNLQKGQCYNLHISAACVPKYTKLDSYDEYQLQKQIKQKQKCLQKIHSTRTEDLIQDLQHQIIDQIKLKDYLFRHIYNEIEIYQCNNNQNLNTETQDSLSKIILALNSISLEANFIGQTKEILNLIGNENVSKIKKIAYYKQKLEQMIQSYKILQQNYSSFLNYNESNQSHQISENEKICFAAHSNCQQFLLLDNYYAHFNNSNRLLLQYTLNQNNSLQIFDPILTNKMKNIIQTYVLFVFQQIFQILYQLYLLQIIPIKLSIHNFYWVKSERDSTFQVKFDFKGIDYNIKSDKSDAYFITRFRKLLQEIIINDRICQNVEIYKVIQKIQQTAANFNKQQFRQLFDESVYHLNLYQAGIYQIQSISDSKTNSQSFNEQIQIILHTFLNNKDDYLHFLEEKKTNYSQLQQIEIHKFLRYSKVFYKPIADKIKQILHENRDQNFAEQIKLQILEKASQYFTAQYFSIIQKQIYTDKYYRYLQVNPIIFFIDQEDDDRLKLSVYDQYQNELQIPLTKKQKQNAKIEFSQQINQEIFQYQVDDQKFEISSNALLLLRQHFKKYNYNRILFNQQLKCLLPVRENGLTIWTSLWDFYLYAKIYSNNYTENQADNSKKLQSYKRLGAILYLPCVRQLLNEFRQREKMFQPFRGIYCNHLECFDIKDAYQQICKRDMRCPVVGCQREIFDAYGTPCIVLDIEYKQILNEINNRYIDEKWEGCLYDLNEFIIEIGEDKFLNKKMYLEYFCEKYFQNQEEQTSEQDYEAMEQQALLDDQVLGEEEDEEDEEDD